MIEKLNEIQIEKLVTLAIFTAFVVVVLSMTTCSIHDNMYNAGEAKTDAAEVQSKIAMSQHKHTAEMERIKVVEKLIIEDNVDPIAARCAVEGWTERNNSVCLAIVEKTTNPIEVTQ